MRFVLLILSSSYLLSQSAYCPTDNQINNRSIYSIGDTLSADDQNRLFSVCNGSGDYLTGENFSFSDLNGNLNGGEYKLTIISMNATW